MNDAEWIADVPPEITNDPIWKLEVYRLGLFAGDIGWQDVQFLTKKPMMLSVADQLHRSIDSISINLSGDIPEVKDQTAHGRSVAWLSARKS